MKGLGSIIMNAIISGGGFEKTSFTKAKVRAWIALFGAILLAAIAYHISVEDTFLAYIPSFLLFVCSLILFFSEKAQEIAPPQKNKNHHLRKLYSVDHNK